MKLFWHEGDINEGGIIGLQTIQLYFFYKLYVWFPSNNQASNNQATISVILFERIFHFQILRTASVSCHTATTMRTPNQLQIDWCDKLKTWEATALKALEQDACLQNPKAHLPNPVISYVDMIAHCVSMYWNTKSAVQLRNDIAHFCPLPKTHNDILHTNNVKIRSWSCQKDMLHWYAMACASARSWHTGHANVHLAKVQTPAVEVQ